MQNLLADINRTYINSTCTWFTVYCNYFEYFQNLSWIDYLNNSLHFLGLLLRGLFLSGRELGLFLLFLRLLLLLRLFFKPRSSFLPVNVTLTTKNQELYKVHDLKGFLNVNLNVHEIHVPGMWHFYIIGHGSYHVWPLPFLVVIVFKYIQHW